MTTLTIGKVAKMAGVGVETVRFYERQGIILRPPKPPIGGFRTYPEETVQQIRFIRQAQELGFSLREIKGLLSLRADPATDCADVREQARQKVEDVDHKIERLLAIRNALETLIAACPGRGALRTCSIMEAMNDGEVRPGREPKDKTRNPRKRKA